jgi:hypothetical protein
MLQPVERRVKRALLDEQRAPRDLLYAQQHAVAVQLAKRNRFEYQDVQRPGEKVDLTRHALSYVA